MAIGDDSRTAGYPTVPDIGEEGRVRWGAREINRTRDLIAGVQKLVPKGRKAHRDLSGITSGTQLPNNSNGENGDIYFRIVG